MRFTLLKIWRAGFCAALAAWLMVAVLAGAAVAGPYEDANAAYQRGDYATAWRIWQPLAQRGEARAQNGLGGMYRHGEGVPQNYTEALKWFRKAAEQGDARGQVNLGGMYHYGEGVPQSDAEALRWYRRAAEQGNTLGLFNLGGMYHSGCACRRITS
jgi:TPR repeat protein